MAVFISLRFWGFEQGWHAQGVRESFGQDLTFMQKPAEAKRSACPHHAPQLNLGKAPFRCRPPGVIAETICVSGKIEFIGKFSQSCPVLQPIPHADLHTRSSFALLREEAMKRFAQSLAGLILMCSMVGCCWRPGYVDPCTGICYGGFFEPICWGPLDPCWWLSCLCPCGVPPYASACAPAYDPCCTPAPACGCGVCADPAIAPLSYAGHHGPDCGCPSPGWSGHHGIAPGGAVPHIVPNGVVPMPQEQVAPAPAASTSYYPMSNGPVFMQQATQVSPATAAPVRDARAQQWLPSRL